MKKAQKSKEISLDNTLRWVYSTLRNKGASLVAIEFRHGGKIWRVDTVEEALKLRNALEEEDRAAYTLGDQPRQREEHDWTPDVLTDLLQSLGEHQKSFLRLLYEHQGYVPSQQIVKALALDSEVSFAGVLSGLSKQAKKLNIMPWKIYEVIVTWQGKSKTRLFRLTNGFRMGAGVIGWPETWI
jgi:hypothetical protein